MHNRIRWSVAASRLQAGSNSDVLRIAEELGITVPTSQLLVNRGCADVESAKKFIRKEGDLLYDPFLMKDMEKAVGRIRTALSSDEKIVIFGDYDVDGVTSVSCLYLYLKEKGADISYYIPQRAGEGYGVSVPAIEKLAEEGAKLIITVDTGITAVEEIERAKELGVDVVVTDHHECHDVLPDAAAVVNPRRPDCPYPFKELAGVGVVFKVLCALEASIHSERSLYENVKKIAREYGDLVAIGTIADVMPVKDENRPIVSYGLSLIDKTERPGLIELFKAVSADSKVVRKRKVTASFIGFTIAPKINAAGRIASASIAVELFLADNTEKAAEIAKQLCEINKERQAGENEIVESAYLKVGDHDFDRDPVIILDDDSWHHGIIGIVASRITEKYSYPSILISFEGSENGEVGKGSGRSVKGLNLVDALRECSDLLEKFGGHELAVGLAIKRENLPEFKRRLNDYAREKLTDMDTENVIEADLELQADDITLAQAEELFLLEPYGVSNPTPSFVMYDVPLYDITMVSNGKHSRLTLKIGQNYVTAMAFRKNAAELNLFPGDRVDVLFSLDINEFRDQKTVQLVVKDVRLTDKLFESEKKEEVMYKTLVGSSSDVCFTTDEIKEIFPRREDFASVYNVLRRETRGQAGEFTVRGIRNLLKRENTVLRSSVISLILAIFSELGFIKTVPLTHGGERFTVELVQQSGKTPLESSKIYQKIKSLTEN